uniref:Protein kinase domain-containing protein n=1 Tax=Chromera velia CCMP2878 TaxID=1169474 RepID=A0A0K6S9D3_9ALVE|eukprot:Cvel_7475.t1-p1 / transcript=Cvel_7475.t1 / gene=Cvel_7475 / organism=Chromera_velia_CCMP2878 / gene_product=hypothetical protein / transcript_product=hypothetical protein / location=Cvel_scaffold391:34816-42159(+) / protein_length=1544 / sequence_SO=supercontig / SO=protein_coding / is_pseudo=false
MDCRFFLGLDEAPRDVTLRQIRSDIVSSRTRQNYTCITPSKEYLEDIGAFIRAKQDWASLSYHPNVHQLYFGRECLISSQNELASQKIWRLFAQYVEVVDPDILTLADTVSGFCIDTCDSVSALAQFEKRFLDAGVQLACAVTQAHSHGIIHMAVHAKNVLVSPRVNLASPRFSVDNSDGGGGGEGGNVPPRDEVDLASSIVARRMRTKNMFSSALSGLSEADLGLKPSKESFDIPLQLRLSNFLCSTPLLSSDEGKLFEVLELVDVCLVLLHLATSLSFEEFCKVGLDAQQNELSNSHGSVNSKRSFASFCGRLSISARREGDGGGTRRGGGSVRKSVLLNLGVSSMEDEERARLRAEKERERAEREQEGAHMEPDKFLQRELPHARIQLAGRFAQALQAAEDSRSRDLLREFEGQKKKGRKGKLVEWQRTLTGVSTSVDADRFQKRPDKDVVTTPSSLHLPLPHETSGLSHSPGTASSKEKHVELQDAGSSASEGSTNRHSESHLGRSVGDSSPTAHIRGILSAKPSENNEDASRSSRLLAHTKSLRFAERTDEGGPEGESLMIGSLSMDLEEEKRKAEAREKKNEDIARRERVNRVIRFRTFVMDWNQVEQFFFWAVEVMRDVAFDMSGRTLWKVPGCDDEGEEYQLTVRGKNEGWDDEDDEEDDLSSGEREDLTGIEKRIQTFLIMTARVILDATKRLIAVLESQPEKELRALGQRVNKATEIEAYLEFIENENESDRLKGKEEKMPDGEKEKMEMGKGCTAEWLLDGLFDSLQQAGAPAGHHILPHRLSSDERKFFASRGLLMRGLCLMEAQKCRTALRMFEVARSYDSSFIEAAVNAVLLRFSLEAREREGDLGELDGLLAEGCDELLEDFRTGGERTRGGETGTIAAPLRTVSKRGSVGSQNKMDDVSERRLWDPWACQAPLVSFGRLGLLKDLYGLPGPAAEAEGSRVLSLFGELQSLPVSTVRDAAAVAALLKGGWLIEAALIADRGLARVKGLAPARVLTPFEVAPSGRNSKSGLGLVHMADLPFVSFLLQAHAALVRLFSEVNIFAVLSPLCGLPTLYFTHSSRATASIPNGVAIPPGTNASQMPRLKKRLGASVTLQGHNETSEGSGAKSSFLFAKETLDVDASFASAVREASTGLRQFPLEHVHVHFCSPDYILLHGGAFSVACAHESKCGRAAPGHIKETTSLLLHVSKQRHDFWLLEMQPPSSCPIARLMVSLPSRRVLVVLYVNGDLQTFDLENKRTAFGLLRSQGLLGQEATQNDGVPSFHFLKPAKPLLLPRRLTDQIRDLIQGDNRVCLEAYNRRLRLRTKQKPRLFRARVSASPSRSRRETTNIRGEEIFQEDEDEEEGGFILNNLTVPHLEHVNCLDMAQTAELYASPNACVVFLFRDRWRAPQRFGTESSQIVEDELDYANSDPSTLTTLRVAQLRLKEGRVYGQHILTVKYEDTDTEMMAQKQKGKKTAPYGGNQGDNLAGAAGLNRDDTAAAKRASTVQQHTGGVIDGDPGGGAFDLRRVKRWTAFVGAHLLWSAACTGL